MGPVSLRNAAERLVVRHPCEECLRPGERPCQEETPGSANSWLASKNHSMKPLNGRLSGKLIKASELGRLCKPNCGFKSPWQPKQSQPGRTVLSLCPVVVGHAAPG